MDILISQTHGDVLVVYFSDASLVNAARIDAVGSGLMDMMKRAAHGKLLLNFQVVKSMASAMLGKLIKLKKECDAAKIDLKLCHVGGNILEAFEVTRLDRVFDIHDDESSALKAFGRTSWFSRR